MRVTLNSLAVALVASAVPVMAAAGDVDAGKALAQTWCKSCHVVDRTSGGTDVVPPFAAIASDRTLTPDRLRAFLANPRHPMPNPQLANTEIEDLVAYIQSLKR